MGQLTTLESCNFRIEFAFHYCMKVLPCYYTVSAHFVSNVLADINKRFQKWNWLKFSISLQCLNFGKRVYPQYQKTLYQVGPSSLATI